jgi:acyl transferase domain-containing protein
MVSSVTNVILPRTTILDETYWSANLLSPVLFNQAIQTIRSSEEFAHIDTLIEVGPHSALSGPIRQIKGEFKFEKLQYLPTLIRNENSAASILRLAGELFLRIRDLPWLKDHSLGGEAVFLAAGYFSMVIEAITQVNERSSSASGTEGYVLRDVSIKQALVTPDDDTGIEMMLNLRPSVHPPSEDQSPWWDFNVSSVAESGHVKEHMAGSISITTRRQGSSTRAIPNLPQRESGKSWNQALNEVGFCYGPTFQDMENIHFDDKRYAATCETRLKTTVEGMVGESRHVLHPATVDSCFAAPHRGELGRSR